MMPVFHTDTLSFHLTLRYAAAFSLFLAAAFGCALLLVHTSMQNEINDDLSEDLAQYRTLFSQGGIGTVIDEVNRDIKPSDTGDEFVNIIDRQGQVVFQVGADAEGPGLNAEILAKIAAEAHSDEIYFETRGLPNREFAMRVAYSVIGPGVIMQIGESLELPATMMELLIYLFLVSFLIAIPTAFIFGWFVIRRAVRGIEKVSAAATAIRNGNLDSQADVSDQSSEIRNLGNTFNSMAHRIRDLITEMRELIDNIAHDLRTPLGRIRMISEMTLSTVDNEACKAAAVSTLEQCDKVLQYVNAILDVAEAEAGISTVQDEPVDISAITSDACELFETIADEKKIRFTSVLEPGCIVFGCKQNLQRMIANVLDNALKYTRENGQVEIKVERHNNAIEIRVTDTGIGIPCADQQRVFDRFYRCDQSRGEDGCGLGLSFSRAVARSHQGDITLTSKPGIGSEFLITVPARQ